MLFGLLRLATRIAAKQGDVRKRDRRGGRGVRARPTSRWIGRKDLLVCAHLREGDPRCIEGVGAQWRHRERLTESPRRSSCQLGRCSAPRQTDDGDRGLPRALATDPAEREATAPAPTLPRARRLGGRGRLQGVARRGRGDGRRARTSLLVEAGEVLGAEREGPARWRASLRERARDLPARLVAPPHAAGLYGELQCWEKLVDVLLAIVELERTR